MPRLLRVKAVKPTVINLGDDAQADLLLLHKIAELVTINQINSRRHDCGGVAGGSRKSGQGDQYSALRSGRASITLEQCDDISAYCVRRRIAFRLHCYP